ncbi:MAG: hypothetical protein AB9869_03885 [Verrucomicrobiia bacterium]
MRCICGGRFSISCGSAALRTGTSFLRSFAAFGREPHRRGDFTERDKAGREIEVLVLRRYAILYWADHPVKEVKITEVRLADR